MSKNFLLGAAALAFVSNANAAAVDSSHFTPTTFCVGLTANTAGTTRVQLNNNDPTVVIFNLDPTASTAYVVFGDITATSDITQFPVPATSTGRPTVLTQKQSNKSPARPYIAAIVASGTEVLKICQGQGGSPN